jgi:hypothetical protein
MLLQGAVVLFGPDYLENSLLMLKELKGALAGKAVLSCEKIDDLRVPHGPALSCMMVFFHRVPDGTTYMTWEKELLKGLSLRSQPPKGLGVADQSPEEPTVELVPVNQKDMQLIVTWRRPLEASHFVQVARALERSYLENGGQYGAPGVFKRLRGLFS